MVVSQLMGVTTPFSLCVDQRTICQFLEEEEILLRHKKLRSILLGFCYALKHRPERENS